MANLVHLSFTAIELANLVHLSFTAIELANLVHLSFTAIELANLVHLSFTAIELVVSLTLSFYCFRLIKKFFKGGIFETTFKAFMITGFFVVIGLVFDIAASSTEFNLIDLHMFHVALEVVALIIFLFGVHSLYKAWTKLGL